MSLSNPRPRAATADAAQMTCGARPSDLMSQSAASPTVPAGQETSRGSPLPRARHDAENRPLPGGRGVIVDFHEAALPVGPPPSMKLAREEVIATFTPLAH